MSRRLLEAVMENLLSASRRLITLKPTASKQTDIRGRKERGMTVVLAAAAAVALLVVLVAMKSVHRIGPAQIGLVNKKVAFRKLHGDNPIAFRGEAGYQAELLMPGLRFHLWPIYSV